MRTPRRSISGNGATANNHAQGRVTESEQIRLAFGLPDMQRLRALLNYSFDASALVDTTGRITYVSPAYERIVGCSPEAIVGSFAWDQLVSDDDTKDALAFFSDILRSPEPSLPRRYKVSHRNGSLRTIEIRAWNRLDDPQCQSIVVNLRDVTEEGLAIDRYNVASSMLEALFTTTHLRIVILDQELRYVRATQAVADVDGVPVDDHPGRRPADIQPSLWSQVERACREVLASKKSQTVTIEESRPSDPYVQSHTLRVHLFPIALSATETGIAGITDDISAEVDRETFEAEALKATVEAIAAAAEWRDPYTAGHQRRVAELSVAIAARLFMAPDDIEGIRVAASIHDIGKLAIPAEILSKPSRLMPAEMELVRMHPQVGYDIVKGIRFPWPVPDMILQHHERTDGSGYPNALAGDEIVPGAKIIAVADTFEAITSHRPYRPGRPVGEALAVISDTTKFEPDVAQALAAILNDQDDPLAGRPAALPCSGYSQETPID